MRDGSPRELAESMMRDPEHYLRRHIGYFGELKGKSIANLLGGSGRKAIPLAIMGAQVTVVDISPENRRFAVETAREAGVDINFIVSDLFELDRSSLNGTFDIVYLEGGILHYFSDLDRFAEIVFDLLKIGGRLILNDFHPLRKIMRSHEGTTFTAEGDYFDASIFHGSVAYQGMFPAEEQGDFPPCLLRFWNLGEIVSAGAGAGLVIGRLTEEPRYDEHKHLPGNFTLLAHKYNVDRSGWV